MVKMLIAWLAFVGVAFAGQRAMPASVFVTSVGAMSGMTDPSKDNRDTVKNLKDDLKDKRDVRLVESADDAVIVLTVLGRETAQITAGLFGDPARDRVIRVRFKAGDLETDMTASAQGGTLASGGAWSRAAGKIAQQVQDWIVANRERLLVKRT